MTASSNPLSRNLLDLIASASATSDGKLEAIVRIKNEMSMKR
jgi:hypothetical protein